MSGFVRNLLTLLAALLARGSFDARACLACHFIVTPLDCGTRVLKSDKFLQLAEAAQLDFLVRTRLIGALLRGGVAFVNVAQLVRFIKPVGMFTPVRVETAIVFADEKCAYFSHTLFVRGHRHGEVLVRMKFKKGAITVPPRALIGDHPAARPPHILAWDHALDAMP